jgi:hypothetical protein
LLISLNDLVPDRLKLLRRKMVFQIVGDAKDFGCRGTNELVAAPGTTLLASERRRRGELFDSSLNRVVGQAGGVRRDFNHLQGSALGVESGAGFQPLGAASV